ncbi:hypothetical protein H0W91_02105 [Patescibacteria group bacterium]|nr:hypothetical protein [Patescibacteria group bacterium]
MKINTVKQMINLNYFKVSKNQRESFFQIFLIVFVFTLVIIFSFYFGSFSKQSLSTSNKISSEITEIKTTTNPSVQAKLYRQLIERVGPAEAQDDLLNSGLPFTGQTHLLNHVVGDFLYEKFGTKGLAQCKDYFLSSCYHGFILHVIADKGIEGVKETFNECLKFGPTVYSQCAHGIGHGFLASVGYKNLTLALDTCDKVGKAIKEFPLFNCYDGVFMENIWAVHEGVPSPDRWVKPGDILYPCNDPRINSKYITACWSNQPSLIYQFYKGDVKKVGQNLCLPLTNPEYQRMCFDGLSRQIHPLTQGSSTKTLSLCGLMPNSKWKNFCVGVNASASYAVGDHNVPFKICAEVSEDGKGECYERIFGIAKAYSKTSTDFKLECNKVTEQSWKEQCLSMQ